MNILPQQVLLVCQNIGKDFATLGYTAQWSGQFWLEQSMQNQNHEETLAALDATSSQAVDWTLPNNRFVFGEVDWHADWVVGLREYFAGLHYLLEPIASGFVVSAFKIEVNFWLMDGQIYFSDVETEGFMDEPKAVGKPTHIQRLELHLLQNQ
jgi:hypothetical protein